MGLSHKHGSGLKVTCTVTGLFCESSFAGLTVVCVRVDSRFRGNDSVGEGIGLVDRNLFRSTDAAMIADLLTSTSERPE